MFVYVIQSNHWLYFILVILFYISPVYGLLYQYIVVTFVFVLICFWMLYLCLLPFFVYFIRYTTWFYSILGILSVFFPVYDFLMPMYPYSFTCLHKSGLTPICFNLSFICHVYWNTYISSWFLDISYICFSLEVFFMTLRAAHNFSSLKI